jgi:hypothetical protein
MRVPDAASGAELERRAKCAPNLRTRESRGTKPRRAQNNPATTCAPSAQAAAAFRARYAHHATAPAR